MFITLSIHDGRMVWDKALDVMNDGLFIPSDQKVAKFSIESGMYFLKNLTKAEPMTEITSVQ